MPVKTTEAHHFRRVYLQRSILDRRGEILRTPGAHRMRWIVSVHTAAASLASPR